MGRSWSWAGSRLVRSGAVVLVVAGLVLAVVTAAHAHGPGEERARDTSAGDAQVMAAIQRDLGLTQARAEALLAGSAEAAELDARLRDELGDAYAGSWLHQRTGRLVVAVTDPRAARTVREHGAGAKLVGRGQQQLDAIMTGVGSSARASAGAGDGAVQEWYVDPEANQVVVTLLAGQDDVAADLRAEHGDAVRIETVDGVAEPSNHATSPSWLDAGIAYESCSVGFNVRNPNNAAARYVLTAGHCHRMAGTVPVGGTVSSHGKTIGPVRAAFYGPEDDGLVQVTNTAGWNQGPYVWIYGGGSAGLSGNLLQITEWVDAPVGATVCKSGWTTGLTCGRINAKNVSVTYTNPDGSRTNLRGLVRHTACQRGGDSGGPTFTATFNSGSVIYRAAGINSGSNNLSNGQCRSTVVGGTNVTYYYPLAISMPYYGLQLW